MVQCTHWVIWINWVKILKNSRDATAADWPFASALPLPLVRIPDSQGNPECQESIVFVVTMTQSIMITQRVNVTQRVIMLHCLMVLYA